MTRKQAAAPGTGPSLTPEQGKLLLKARKEEGEKFLAENRFVESEIEPWRNSTIDQLTRALGSESSGYYLSAFLNWQTSSYGYGEDEEEAAYASDVKRALPGALNTLSRCIEFLESQSSGPRDQISSSGLNDPMQKVRLVLQRFRLVARQLERRHQNRETVKIADEYDVQDLLHALLRMFFNDIRPEEWTPSYADGSARVDFFLKPEGILVEVKKTRQGLAERQIGEQLIVDIERYKNVPGCQHLVCFVYDPDSYINNPAGLRSDLSGRRDHLAVEVIIEPSTH